MNFFYVAVIESRAANAGYAIRNGNTCNAAAVGESPFANFGHAIRDGNAIHVAATIKSIYTNAGHAVRHDDILVVPNIFFQDSIFNLKTLIARHFCTPPF